MIMDQELADLGHDIAQRRQYIEDQQILIQVLEQDGHDVVEQKAALNKARSTLAMQVAKQFQLLAQSF